MVTLNVGVFDPMVWRLVWGKEQPRFVREVECVVRSRIGRIPNDDDEENLDEWWDWKETDEIHDLAKTLFCQIEEKAIPFLYTFEYHDYIYIFLRSRRAHRVPFDHIQYAIAVYLAGEREWCMTELCKISDI